MIQLNSISFYTKDKFGNVIPKYERVRNADSCQFWLPNKKFIYSDKGLLIEEQPLSENQDTFRYSYDQQGYLVYMDFGFLLHYRYVNNSSGKPIQKYELIPGEKDKLSVEYFYNSNGLLETEKWIKKDAVYKTITFKYKYDSLNNWIEKISFESDEYNDLKAKSIITRDIKYYD